MIELLLCVALISCVGWGIESLAAQVRLWLRPVEVQPEWMQGCMTINEVRRMNGLAVLPAGYDVIPMPVSVLTVGGTWEVRDLMHVTFGRPEPDREQR